MNGNPTPPLERIAVGVDFAEPSRAAAAWVARCLAPDVELLLVHAVDGAVPHQQVASSPAPDEQKLTAAMQLATERLNALGEGLPARSVSVRAGSDRVQMFCLEQRDEMPATPEERAWMDHIIDNEGYVDAFRVVNPSPDEYTWWSNRGRAWEKNVGWRLDYHLVTPNLSGAVAGASVYRDQRYSDHAPVAIDYDLSR